MDHARNFATMPPSTVRRPSCQVRPCLPLLSLSPAVQQPWVEEIAEHMRCPPRTLSPTTHARDPGFSGWQSELRGESNLHPARAALTSPVPTAVLHEAARYGKTSPGRMTPPCLMWARCNNAIRILSIRLPSRSRAPRPKHPRCCTHKADPSLRLSKLACFWRTLPKCFPSLPNPCHCSKSRPSLPNTGPNLARISQTR